MVNLLHTDFTKLKKDKLFWLGFAVMAGMAVFSVANRAYESRTIAEYAYDTADPLWFAGGMYISLVLSVFISIWIGTDFHDGTIRNKLIVGHTRFEVYFSNFIVTTVVSLFYHIVYIGIIWGLGAVLLKPFATPPETLLILTIISFFTVIAVSALFTMLSMLIHNRTASVVIAMLLALAMMMGASVIENILSAPEVFDTGFEMNEAGEIVKSEPFVNPDYPTETERKVYEQIQKINPAGQIMQLIYMTYEPDVVYLMLYSLALIIITTATGLAFFRKKDIK